MRVVNGRLVGGGFDEVFSASHKIKAAPRPYILTFDSGQSNLLTSEEVQRLLDAYSVVMENEDCVRISNPFPSTIRPATAGGGPAFKRVRV